MHPSVALLEEALALIPLERTALSDEDLDRAGELAEQRRGLVDEAWGHRAGCDEAELRVRLVRMQQAQADLEQSAEALQTKYRQQQVAGRNQAKYFTTERHLHAASRKSFYCDTRF